MFAIFFPGKTGYTEQHLKDAELGDLLDDVKPAFGDLIPGPDGGPGVYATWSQELLTGREQLEWTKCQRSEVGGQRSEFWLGRLAGEKPQPEWFARARQQLGEDVVMADGQKWHIPIARQLPQILQLDDGGQWRGTVAPSYKSFYDTTWSTLDWFKSVNGICRVSYSAGADFVALALSINYRVNRDVASWLGLIRSDLFLPVAKVVTEFEELMAALEKKTGAAVGAGGPATSAGDAA
jgi:hypothetical protein